MPLIREGLRGLENKDKVINELSGKIQQKEEKISKFKRKFNQM